MRERKKRMIPARRPLVPEDLRSRPSDHLVRALLATARAHFDPDMSGPEGVARKLWPDDVATQIVLRTATIPADTLTSGWASQLAATSIADLVTTLGPASAAGELFRRATMLEFGQSAAINVPGIISAATDAAWVAQGVAIPVRQLSVGSGAALVPKKLAAGFTLTRELLQHSIPNAEKIIRAAATESVGVALDSAVLDATAASASRPAGLRNSATSVSATAGGGTAALLKDMGALAAAVAGVGGMSICYVASPGEAVKIALQAPQFPFPVLSSGQLAAGIVMCVALPALVSAVDPAVRFDVSSETLLHLEDTSAGPISFESLIASSRSWSNGAVETGCHIKHRPWSAAPSAASQ
jgi:hypothetical protein